MILLPATGDRVVLRPDEDSRHPVVVDGLDGDRLLVSAPSLPGEVLDDRVGTTMGLEWATPRGLVTASVRLEGGRRDRVKLWELLLVGDPEVVQRRRYARAGVTEAAVLLVLGPEDRSEDAVPEDDDAPSPGRGLLQVVRDPVATGPQPWTTGSTVVELSEGAVVVHVPEGGVAVEDRIEMHLVLDGEQVVLPGVVARASDLVPPGHGAQRLLVLLQTGPVEATLLRRTVLRAQLEQRRRTSA